jgi:hypothetical protein
MQRLLVDSHGSVRAREVLFAQRWLGGASAKHFGERIKVDAGFTALCTECRQSFQQHGWTGTDYACPGDWLVQDRAGTLRRVKPGAFLDEYEPEQRQSPPPREI